MEGLSDLDKQIISSILTRVGRTQMLSFIQGIQQSLQIKANSLKEVIKEIKKSKFVCDNLIVKFRGYDADIIFCEDKKIYIKGHGDGFLPDNLLQFPQVLEKTNVLRYTQNIQIHFPYLMFEHEIFSKWNEVLVKKAKVRIIVQQLQSRKNFDPKIQVIEKNWRDTVKWK